MTSMRSVFQGLLGLVFVLETTGCSQILGALRRDFDDGDPFRDAPATVGGRAPGQGFLADEMAVGHSERVPASMGNSSALGGHSWVTAERDAANHRDVARAAAAEEEGPNPETHPVLEPSVRRQYKNGMRATRSDFVDEAQNEGSLWGSDGQTNYYFSKNKIRGVGDIVSITVETDLLRDIGLEARRTLTQREREYELNVAQERLKQKALGLGGDEKKDAVSASQAAPARTPAAGTAQGAPEVAKAEVDVPLATYADVDVGKSLEVKASDVMMGEIIERYPNGNYKVRATKRIPYKGGAPRNVTLVGVVKGGDISEEDVIPSGKLYEYRVEASK